MQKSEQILELKLQNYLDLSNSFYQDLLGYKPEQTSLQQISEIKWNEFKKQRGLNPDSSGIYFPRNQTAVIRDENPLSLFHEYFGHGLYCEKSLEGKKLVDLEKKLLKEEKKEFFSKKFNLKDLQKFRKRNQTFQELESFKQVNLGRYEFFAIWTEYLLAREFGLIDRLERKYDFLKKEDKEQIEKIISLNKQYGNLATFYSFGLARKTTPKRVRLLLKDIYKDKLKNVKLALLYGSKKEFSDIDIFIVSDGLQEAKTDWLDVAIRNQFEFERQASFFDVAVTDAIISGEFLFGDKNYFEQQRRKLVEQPITDESVKYNLNEEIEQKLRALKYPQNSKERHIGLLYSLTYKLLSKNLKQGNRILTKEELIKNLQSESFIELKGGIIK